MVVGVWASKWAQISVVLLRLVVLSHAACMAVVLFAGVRSLHMLRLYVHQTDVALGIVSLLIC